jgi:hypothetical protein
VGCAWEKKLYKVLVGNTEGMKPLERPRHKLEDGIVIEKIG